MLKPFSLTSLLLTAWLALATLPACSDNIQPEYNVKLLALPGQTPLTGATSVSLEAVGSGLQTTVAVTAGQLPTLSLRGLDSRKVKAATFVVKVNGPQGLIAYGRSPRIRLVNQTIQLFVLVQTLGSLASASEDPLIPRLADGAVVTAAIKEPEEPQAVAVPVILGGKTINTAGNEEPTRVAVLYNPYLHAVVTPNLFTATATGAAVLARADGTIWFFGGRTEGPPLTFSGVANQIGTDQLLNEVTMGLTATYTPAPEATQVPREGAVLAEVPVAGAAVLLAFGGQTVPDSTMPAAVKTLSSVVLINPALAAGVVSLFGPSMLAPRSGHTATVINVNVPPTATAPAVLRTDVLLFGGTFDPAGPVAEVYDATLGQFAALADAGPPRVNHAVLALPDGRQLIVGGVDASGVPIADVRIYEPLSRTFTPFALPLQRPRSGAAIFVLGNDLVVCGGLDATNAPVPDAERFDLATLAPLPALPAAPRTGAKVAYLPDGTALLIGGRAPDAGGLRPTSTIEVYRPRDVPAAP
ncbi:MAG: hypothetical protein SF187_10190 [Deltaproteobacteria bacterium]|nr:hypothetical protein [Deltaproteobacteria bacterium]